MKNFPPAGDAIIESINDVKMSDVLSTSADAEAKDIYGNIEIRQDISVIGKLDVDYINGANITALYEKALLIDEDATIDGSIVSNLCFFLLSRLTNED